MTALEGILKESRQEEKLARLHQIKQASKRVERAKALASGATMTGKEKKKARRTASEGTEKAQKTTNAHQSLLKVRSSEDELRKKYPQVIKGTLGYDNKANKQTCAISCTECKTKRDVYTSDLHQVDKCRPCTQKARQERRTKRYKKQSGEGKAKMAGRKVKKGKK